MTQSALAWPVRALTVALLFVHAGGAFGQEGCGSLANAFGPWDYTDPRNKRELANVNGNHFNANVRNLVRGQTSANIGGDIDYTLRAFPNHHRALAAMLRLSAKEGRERPLGATYTVGCYFERAVQFKPDDPAARLLYAKYLSGKDRHDEALAQLRQADQLDPEDGNIKYNMGLALFELKRYDEAADQARQAYALGFPLDGLRKKLERVGKWQPARN